MGGPPWLRPRSEREPPGEPTLQTGLSGREQTADPRSSTTSGDGGTCMLSVRCGRRSDCTAKGGAGCHHHTTPHHRRRNPRVLPALPPTALAGCCPRCARGCGMGMDVLWDGGRGAPATACIDVMRLAIHEVGLDCDDDSIHGRTWCRTTLERRPTPEVVFSTHFFFSSFPRAATDRGHWATQEHAWGALSARGTPLGTIKPQERGVVDEHETGVSGGHKGDQELPRPHCESGVCGGKVQSPGAHGWWDPQSSPPIHARGLLPATSGRRALPTRRWWGGSPRSGETTPSPANPGLGGCARPAAKAETARYLHPSTPSMRGVAAAASTKKPPGRRVPHQPQAERDQEQEQEIIGGQGPPQAKGALESTIDGVGVRQKELPEEIPGASECAKKNCLKRSPRRGLHLRTMVLPCRLWGRGSRRQWWGNCSCGLTRGDLGRGGLHQVLSPSQVGAGTWKRMSSEPWESHGQ